MRIIPAKVRRDFFFHRVPRFEREDDGSVFEVDLAFDCSGPVRSASTPKLPAYARNVLLAGDIVDKAPRLAYVAEASGRLAARRVLAAVRGAGGDFRVASDEGLAQMFPLRAVPRLMLISLHAVEAVLVVGPIVVGGRVPALIKSVLERMGVAAARGGSCAGAISWMVEMGGFAFANALDWVSRLLGVDAGRNRLTDRSA